MPSTATLLERVRLGDHTALDVLMERYLPRLRRWAHGRLPQWARDGLDTQDIVQDSLLRTFSRLENFDNRADGALHAYLRQVVSNRISDELRRAAAKPPALPLDFDVAGVAPSPIETVIGKEALDRYERGLRSLKPADREAVIARVEMGCSYREIADALDKPTANAARMAVERALIRLAIAMEAGDEPPAAPSRT